MATQAAQMAEAPQSTQSPEVRLTHDEIAVLAYTLWKQRGCPHGSSDEDWFEAEAQLTSR